MTPERLAKSEKFLDKWGHLAIFLGRFFPFIRTFVPFIAGMLASVMVKVPAELVHLGGVVLNDKHSIHLRLPFKRMRHGTS